MMDGSTAGWVASDSCDIDEIDSHESLEKRVRCSVGHWGRMQR